MSAQCLARLEPTFMAHVNACCVPDARCCGSTERYSICDNVSFMHCSRLRWGSVSGSDPAQAREGASSYSRPLVYPPWALRDVAQSNRCASRWFSPGAERTPTLPRPSHFNRWLDRGREMWDGAQLSVLFR